MKYTKDGEHRGIIKREKGENWPSDLKAYIKEISGQNADNIRFIDTDGLADVLKISFHKGISA